MTQENIKRILYAEYRGRGHARYFVNIFRTSDALADLASISSIGTPEKIRVPIEDLIEDYILYDYRFDVIEEI